ncbi:MAG: SPFH domain-containing protein [Patescibacteria group bacterium]
MEIFLGFLAIVVAGVYIWFGIFEVPAHHIGILYKRFSFNGATRDPVAFRNEAGYQPTLKMSGWRYADPIFYRHEIHPWARVEGDKIGYVIANVGHGLRPGQKTAEYKEVYGRFEDIRKFILENGQKGIQRLVLPPGTFLPIHPVGFTIATLAKVFGVMSDLDLVEKQVARTLSYKDFGFTKEDFELTTISNQKMGIVTCLDGSPLPPDAVACRIGEFGDVARKEAELDNPKILKTELWDTRKDKEHELGQKLLEYVLRSNNNLHENFQNPAAFFENGGKMGPQFYPLASGNYAINKKLFSVKIVDIVTVAPGEALVISAGLGLPAFDITDAVFKYGAIVRPGHHGVWYNALSQGQYLINTEVLQIHRAQTNLLTLFFSPNRSSDHGLDKELKSITALSKNNISMTLDVDALAVVPSESASMVIASFGSMHGFIKDFMAARMLGFATKAVRDSNAEDLLDNQETFRAKLKDEMRKELMLFSVELEDIIIQEVIGDSEYMTVRKNRTIAEASKETLKVEKEAEEKRAEKEEATARANRKKDVVNAQTEIQIREDMATARKKEALGEAEYIEKTLQALAGALGQENAMVIQAIAKLAESKHPIVPEAYVAGSGNGSSASPFALLIPMLKDLARGTKDGAKTSEPSEPLSLETKEGATKKI